MPIPTPELRALLAAESERVRRGVGAVCAAVSQWERDGDRLRTLLRVGEPRPEGADLYPLDTFPAIDALLRFGRPYLDPPDVASVAVLARLRLGSQAAVPVIVEGSVWGELWAAAGAGDGALTAADVIVLAEGAEAIGRLLAVRADD